MAAAAADGAGSGREEGEPEQAVLHNSVTARFLATRFLTGVAMYSHHGDQTVRV